MSDIQLLTSRSASLGDAVDWWNKLMLWSLVFVAVAAIAVLVTTFMVISRSKQLADVQDEIIKQKDAKLAYDLREKDERIADAREQSSKANERAAESERQAADARLESERLKKTVAWREISKESSAAIEEILSSSPGVVNLRYVDGDPEAMYLAIQFGKLLNDARWKVASGAVKVGNGIPFGIIVPDADGEDVKVLRAALSSGKLPFGTAQVPMGIGFNFSVIPGAPTLFIGSKFPAKF